jgi:hypothetical protein
VQVILLLAALAILGGAVLAAAGRAGEMATFPADGAPLDSGEVSATDVALLRPPMALWGYQVQATEEALQLIARSVNDRDAEIAALRRQLDRLRGGPGGGPRAWAGPPGSEGPQDWAGRPDLADEPGGWPGPTSGPGPGTDTGPGGADVWPEPVGRGDVWPVPEPEDEPTWPGASEPVWPVADERVWPVLGAASDEHAGPVADEPEAGEPVWPEAGEPVWPEAGEQEWPEAGGPVWPEAGGPVADADGEDDDRGSRR